MSRHESESESKLSGDRAPPRYQFAQLTLTPAGAEPLIKEVLDNSTSPLNRGAIVGRIETLHAARGGKVAGPGSTADQVKKALANMREAGQIMQVGYRHYTAANSDGAAEAVDVEADDEVDSDNEIEDTEELEPTIKILSEIGDGAEKVYVYFFERDRELAAYRNEDF